MREIMTAIDIAASPEQIWRVLTNFPDYPRWNTFIRAIQARALQPGAKLRLRMRLRQGGRARIFSPTITKAVPAAELHWRGKLFVRGLFDGDHAFIIVPQGLKGSRLIQRERFSGLLAPLLFRLIKADTRRSFEDMNRALKRIAEAKH